MNNATTTEAKMDRTTSSLKLPRMKCPCGGQFDWNHDDRSPSGAICRKCSKPYVPSERITVELPGDIRMSFHRRGSFGNTSVVLFTTKTFPKIGNMSAPFTTKMHAFAQCCRYERTAAGKIGRSANRQDYQGTDEQFAAALAAMDAKFAELLQEIA